MSSAFNIPAGFALVPLKSTDAMRYAWMEVYDEKGWNAMQAMWDAVLAVAAVDAVPGEPVDAETWAELYRLREAVKGPKGFATWQDAAVDERHRRVKAERALAAPVASRAGMEPTFHAGVMHLRGAWATLHNLSADMETSPLKHQMQQRARALRDFLDTLEQPDGTYAPAAPAEPSESPWFGIDDEVSLTRAVSVMNDVLTDISGWEDRALAEAVESSKVDLCAMIECIRMRADDSYVPGSKPIDGEAVPILPTTPAPAEPSEEQLNAACLRHTQALQAGLTGRMAMRRALTVAGRAGVASTPAPADSSGAGRLAAPEEQSATNYFRDGKLVDHATARMGYGDKGDSK